MKPPDVRLAGCDIEAVSQRCWDALVIGAGPAGAMAARQLALHGCSVLLVEKANFPRRKVCGCCLNGSALATLAQVGLDPILEQLRAPPILGVQLGTKHKTVALNWPGGVAVSREALDTELVRQAIASGVEFLCGTSATVGQATPDMRLVELDGGQRGRTVRCKLVLVADGIAGHSLRNCDEVRFSTARASWVGAGCYSEHRPPGFQRGQIYMAIGTAGYVGAVEIEDGRIDIAAALEPRALKACGPEQLANAIVAESGLPVFTGRPSVRWMGTHPLTRTPNTRAGHRLFLIGDAAGYVEPFTGEGMAWAFASARAVTPLAIQAISAYSPDLIQQWNQQHRRLLGTKKRVCRFVTRRLRGPLLPGLAVATLARFPGLANPFLRWCNQTRVSSSCHSPADRAFMLPSATGSSASNKTWLTMHLVPDLTRRSVDLERMDMPDSDPDELIASLRNCQRSIDCSLPAID